MHRKAGLAELRLPIGDRMPIQSALERVVALGYGVSYDAVVRGFTPYQTLLDEIAALVDRSRSVADASLPLRVLDVSCGTGTVAVRLARDGHAVVGLDAVERLIVV